MAGKAGVFSEVAGAFAYGTRGGATLLLDTLDDVLPSFGSSGMTKCWLLGIDWCRTEPETFALLSRPAKTDVRVHDGSFVVQQKGCTPRLPWHPKVLLLRGPTDIAVIAGSGNLSRNGLSRGHEVGSVTVVSNPKSGHEKDVADSCQAMFRWFDDVWKNGTKSSSIAAAYEKRFEATARSQPPITDDDAVPADFPSGWTGEKVRQLRTARHLWVEAGNLHKNRGDNKPGDQLMLSAMTRVFFDVEPVEVPKNTKLTDVTVRYGTHVEKRPLRYGNNLMDVLTLPVPGSGGPPAYDQETLRFTRTVEKGSPVYVLKVATGADKKAWAKASQAAGSSFAMRGGRAWGVMP